MDKTIKGLDLAKYCYKLAIDKKAINPVILKLGNLTDITDYFVICNGESSVQIKAIADGIKKTLTKKGIKAIHRDIDEVFGWIVLDFIDVVVHIFSEENRNYYRLEQLWGDAEKIVTEEK